MQPKIGIITTQVKQADSQVGVIETAENEEPEDSDFWKKKFMENTTTSSIDSEGLKLTRSSHCLNHR